MQIRGREDPQEEEEEEEPGGGRRRQQDDDAVWRALLPVLPCFLLLPPHSILTL